MKRIFALLLTAVLCFSLGACGDSQSGSNAPLNDNSHALQKEEQSISQPTDNSDSAGKTESISVENEATAPGNGFVPGTLTYADFEVADYHNTGFHNLVDYFTANPDGTGNTFTECGISVFYADAEADLLGDAALAYRTPRGISLGATVDDVMNVYGNVTLENIAGLPQFSLVTAGHQQTTMAVYQCQISSGACPRITFIFDQDNKVMHISMTAVYKKYVDANVLAQALPYK